MMRGGGFLKKRKSLDFAKSENNSDVATLHRMVHGKDTARRGDQRQIS
jgi:hypothetical protein